MFLFTFYEIIKIIYDFYNFIKSFKNYLQQEIQHTLKYTSNLSVNTEVLKHFMISE